MERVAEEEQALAEQIKDLQRQKTRLIQASKKKQHIQSKLRANQAQLQKLEQMPHYDAVEKKQKAKIARLNRNPSQSSSRFAKSRRPMVGKRYAYAEHRACYCR